ncbi:hypothetical protein KIL84_016401 [Mauremys mutica]|uniref:Uncharacterized protein n=1 Tax=Mauremys mutica TaxID=74926 RepID=A0A9D3X4D6_9SAUR|nr:hypothetical protein KIL84_016401 [Mauremys mutica]
MQTEKALPAPEPFRCSPLRRLLKKLSVYSLQVSHFMELLQNDAKEFLSERSIRDSLPAYTHVSLSLYMSIYPCTDILGCTYICASNILPVYRAVPFGICLLNVNKI